MTTKTSKLIIPSYDECEGVNLAGKANPLEQFIVDNEPAGLVAEEMFREGLQKAIDYVLTSTEYK